MLCVYRKCESNLLVYFCSLPLSLTTKQRFTGPISEKISSRCSLDADAGKFCTNKVSAAILSLLMRFLAQTLSSVYSETVSIIP